MKRFFLVLIITIGIGTGAVTARAGGGHGGGHGGGGGGHGGGCWGGGWHGGGCWGGYWPSFSIGFGGYYPAYYGYGYPAYPYPYYSYPYYPAYPSGYAPAPVAAPTAAPPAGYAPAPASGYTAQMAHQRNAYGVAQPYRPGVTSTVAVSAPLTPGAPRPIYVYARPAATPVRQQYYVQTPSRAPAVPAPTPVLAVNAGTSAAVVSAK